MPSLFPQIKNALRRNNRLLIGTIITPRGLLLAAAKKCAADCLEVRVDHLLRAGMTVTEITRILSRRRHPVLLTLRTSQEGGVYRWKKGERAGIAHLLLSHADVIDIEIDELPAMLRVLKSARKQQKGIVLSAHSIKKPATPAQLRRWINKFRAYRAFFYKIAGRINRPRDLDALTNVLKKYRRLSWALMGLGPQAAHSRIALARLGSCAVYAYLDRPTAPGQPSVAAWKRLAKSLHDRH
jgi:3-dehydroquinate dehydratase-1